MTWNYLQGEFSKAQLAIYLSIWCTLNVYTSIPHDFILIFSDKNSSSNMKIDTLAFLNCLLMNHSPTVFHPHINVIVPVSINSIKEKKSWSIGVQVLMVRVGGLRAQLMSKKYIMMNESP